MSNLTIANTIKEQLGASMLYMIGAKNLVADEKSLTFKITTSKNVTHIKITLMNDDTYTMTFYKIRNNRVKIIENIKDVYFYQLENFIAEICKISTRI